MQSEPMYQCLSSALGLKSRPMLSLVSLRRTSNRHRGELVFTPFRVLPFDVGAPLDLHATAKLRSAVLQLPNAHEREQDTRERALAGSATFTAELARSDGRQLLLDCYADGF